MSACSELVPVYGFVAAGDTPWSGGARSVSEFAGDHFWGFEVPPASVGAVVGLSALDETTSFVEATHALYAGQGSVRVIESGVYRGPGALPYTAGDRFYIVRVGLQVLYMLRPATTPAGTVFSLPGFDGRVFPGELLYASRQPSSGTVFLDAAFYAVDDRVFNETAGVVWAPSEGEVPDARGAGPFSAAGVGALPFAGIGADVLGPTSALVQGRLVFTAMGGISARVSGAGQLRFAGFGADIAISAMARGELTFSVFGGAGVFPAYQGASGVLVFTASGGGTSGSTRGEGSLPFVGLGVGNGVLTLGTEAIGAGDLTFVASGGVSAIPAPTTAASFTILLSLADTADPLAEYAEDISDEVVLSTELLWLLSLAPLERLVVLAQYQTFSQVSAELVSTLRIVDTLASLLAVSLVDVLEAAGSAAVVQAAQLLETLGFADAPQLTKQALAAIADALATGDDVYAAVARVVLDGATTADTVAETARYLNLLAETLTVGDTSDLQRLVLVEALDSVQAAGSVEITAQYLAELLSQARVYALMTSNADVAQGWVMNTEGAMPVSEYDNFKFTSLTWYRGALWGTLDDGIYQLAGDTDAGTAIQAEVASLLLDFGTGRQKRVRSAYLGYTAKGGLVLKVRAVEGGEMTEHWYAATPTQADAPREGVMAVGQGLRSRYWQFELANVDGADFEIDHIELFPVILGRRV